MAVKQFNVDGRLDPDLLTLVRRAEPTIEQVLGRAADRVKVDWQPASRVNEPAARVQLTDDGVTRAAEFTAWDLEDAPGLRWQLYRLWDDVLAERARRMLEAIHEGLDETDGG